jgi:hypothetical protein
MLLESCNSGDYYLQTLAHGLMFYTTASSSGEGSLAYLRAYLLGYSDQDVWEYMQQIEACYDYYNFNLPPANGQTQTGLTAMSANFSEPLTLTSKQQEAIANLKSLSIADIFEKLCEGNYIANVKLSEKAIAEVFAGFEENAVDYALNLLQSPSQNSTKLVVAKRILAQFADLSASKLMISYPQLDESVNANIISSAGPLAFKPAIRDMLIEALDDKNFNYDNNSELVGEPLRICDIAYNQLVLNLNIKDVLRTIRTGMPVETRDYHISVLKAKL